MTRSYQKAAELAAGAQAQARAASEATGTAKELTREQASALIVGLRASLDDVKQLLAEAPKGKGTAAELEALRTGVGGIELSLTEMDASLSGGRYKEAHAKAQAAQQATETIKADILAAIAARKAGRRRG